MSLTFVSSSLGRRQHLGVFLVTAIGMLAVTIFGIIPGVGAIRNGRREISQRQEVISILSQKSDYLTSLDEATLSLQVQQGVEAIPLLLPYQSSLGMLLALSSRHAIGFEELEFSREFSQDKPSLLIHLAIVGTYQSIHSFIIDLYRMLPLSLLHEIDLSQMTPGSVAGDSPSLYRAEISLTVASDKPPASIGKPSDRLPVLTNDMKDALRTIQGFETISLDFALPTSGEPVKSLFPE